MDYLIRLACLLMSLSTGVFALVRAVHRHGADRAVLLALTAFCAASVYGQADLMGTAVTGRTVGAFIASCFGAYYIVHRSLHHRKEKKQ